MSQASLSASFQVGTTAGKDRTLSRNLTRERLLDLVQEFLTRQRLDFTFFPTEGADAGTPEKSAEVRLVLPVGLRTSPEEILRFCRGVHKLIWLILTKFHQTWIQGELRLLATRSLVVWTAATRRGGPLEGAPFALPSLIARRLALEGTIPLESLNLRGLYNTLATHYHSFLPSALARHDSAGVWTLAKGESAVPQDIRELLSTPEKCRAWDASIATWVDDTDAVEPPGYRERGDFISHFQTASEFPTYYVPRLAEIITNQTGPLPVHLCPYIVGAGCCEGQLLNTLAFWLATKSEPAKFNRFLRLARGPRQLACVRRSMVGINVITLTPDGVIAQQRSMEVGSYPGLYILLPAGQLAPTKGYDRPSVFWSFLHELDEEIFKGPEERELKDVLREEHISGLDGRLTYLGYGVDLLTVQVVLWLLFEPAHAWWAKFKAAIDLNWESKGRRPKYLDLMRPDVELVPGVLAGMELAKGALALRQCSGRPSAR